MGVLIIIIVIVIVTIVAFCYANRVIKMDRQDSLDYDELLKHSGPMAEKEDDEEMER